MGKITFLGTAGDSFVASKQIRSSGGLIVESGGIQLHIDPGPGALVRAAEHEINLRANTAILVSNNSILNCNDINAVIDAMTYGGLDKGGVLVANKTVINGADNLKPYLNDFYKNCVERIIVLEPGQKLGIEDVEIIAVKSECADPNALGFKIFTNEFVLGYVSDTKYSKDIGKSYKGCDILILNVLVPGNEEVDNSLNSEGAMKIIKEAEPSLAILTHFGMPMIKADMLSEAREIQRKTGVQILIAKDGMSFVPESYSAESKQKRLNLFKNQETGEVKTEKLKETLVEEKHEEHEEHHDHQEHLKF